MTQRRIPLVGGPRDGQLVEDYGPRYREPIPRRAVAIYLAPDLPLSPSEGDIKCREYIREMWGDEPRYVLETTDLGQPSFHPREEI